MFRRKFGPFSSFGELSRKNRASWLRYEMDKLHDRVAKLRGRSARAAGSEAWWKFWGT
jgi:hypothetical protein